ncbi:Protein of unknown function (DUF2975) [Fodinibius salinus]|uniref:DUF2975 domain-containing protein n=1 Tax=Fodinibius salinus TaxID=860790 RepID=A0A5D3YIS7_9BACT|nr:DUF2975 domain-containing protein [Fodinibius salinus]TYP93472.1 Protein of unknown function (DUF2975) [Fodinibius salinus]
MAWKWFKNDWSIAGFLLFCAQFAWAMYLLSFIVYSALFLLGTLLGSGIFAPFDLPAQFKIQDFTKVVANSKTMDIFGSPIVELDVSTLGTEIQRTWTTSLASVMILGLNGIILYGLTLLKRILQSLQREQPWSKQNSKNLRIIGYLMVLAVPYKYGIGWLSYLTIQQVQLPENISLFWPPIAWELGLAGLAVLLVAYIFEEGTRLYEEQKLTV